MADEPLFNYYRGGWQMQLVPRNGKGWASLAIFMVVILAPTLPMALIGDDISLWLVGVYVLLTIVVTILWIRWAISRSERIDLDQVARDQAEFREWKRRQGGDR